MNAWGLVSVNGHSVEVDCCGCLLPALIGYGYGVDLMTSAALDCGEYHEEDLDCGDHHEEDFDCRKIYEIQRHHDDLDTHRENTQFITHLSLDS